MCLFQIFFKCFTNLFQMSNFSFFVNSRDKLIHSLAAFSRINISIAINRYFSGASAATHKVSVISKSYIWSLHILTDPSRSCQIFLDLHIFQLISKDPDRSQQILTDLRRSCKILSDLSRSSHIPIDLDRSCQIFPDLHIFQQTLKYFDRSRQILADLVRS